MDRHVLLAILVLHPGASRRRGGYVDPRQPAPSQLKEQFDFVPEPGGWSACASLP